MIGCKMVEIVTTRAVVWIEIFLCRGSLVGAAVTTRAVVWIEIANTAGIR